MKRWLGWLGVVFIPVLLAGDPAPTAAATGTCRDGTWVEYRITAAPGRLYFVPVAGEDLPSQTLRCRFTVRYDAAGRPRLALMVSLQDYTPLENLILDAFPLEKLMGAEAAAALDTTNGQAAEYEMPGEGGTPGGKVPATRVLLPGAGAKIEIWKSTAVPFGILKISCGDFQLECVGYGW